MNYYLYKNGKWVEVDMDEYSTNAQYAEKRIGSIATIYYYIYKDRKRLMHGIGYYQIKYIWIGKELF